MSAIATTRERDGEDDKEVGEMHLSRPWCLCCTSTDCHLHTTAVQSKRRWCHLQVRYLNCLSCGGWKLYRCGFMTSWLTVMSFLEVTSLSETDVILGQLPL